MPTLVTPLRWGQEYDCTVTTLDGTTFRARCIERGPRYCLIQAYFFDYPESIRDSLDIGQPDYFPTLSVAREQIRILGESAEHTPPTTLRRDRTDGPLC